MQNGTSNTPSPDFPFGLESTLGSNETQVAWFTTPELREQVLQLVSENLASSAKNEEMLARRLQYSDNGTVQTEPGEPALHVKWQRTQFLAFNVERSDYANDILKDVFQQTALIDLISGRIVIVDEEKPFQASQYVAWPVQRSLNEQVWDNEKNERIPVRPGVRPAQDGERCHYRLTDLADLGTLKSIADANQPWPLTYKVPSMATAVTPPTM